MVSYGNGIVPTIDGISAFIIPSSRLVFVSGSSAQLIIALVGSSWQSIDPTILEVALTKLGVDDRTNNIAKRTVEIDSNNSILPEKR
jgi:hypothetical protein